MGSPYRIIASTLIALMCAGLCIAEPVAWAKPRNAPHGGGGSGMDLLYSDHIPLTATGEPLVAIGLMEGKKTIAAQATAPTQIEFFSGGVHKKTALVAGQKLSIRIVRSTAARTSHYVRLQSFSFQSRERTQQSLSVWHKRGYPAATALQVGTVIGIGGRILDNRRVWIVLPVQNAPEATALAGRLQRRFSTPASAESRLLEKPWAELEISIDGNRIAKATSFVRILSTGPLTIKSVEFGRGYRWHGYEDRAYRGDMYIVVDPQGSLAAVNVAQAESILMGVVPAELFATAPPEALRAQAVAARNHLLSKLGQRHHGQPFHLCSEQHCQVFAGEKKRDPRTDAAVKSTRGKALFKNDKLVHATYSSTCGGYTEDNDTAWAEAPDNALRAKPDFDDRIAGPEQIELFFAGLNGSTMVDWIQNDQKTYCNLATSMRPKKFRWARQFSAEELTQLVAAQEVLRGMGTINNITINGRGKGGKVETITVHGTLGKRIIRQELPIRRLFKNLNSGAFIIDRERNATGTLKSITFRGGGWGHGVGMCQMGAVGRAEHGQRHTEILSHYYNGAELVQLYK